MAASAQSARKFGCDAVDGKARLDQRQHGFLHARCLSRLRPPGGEHAVGFILHGVGMSTLGGEHGGHMVGHISAVHAGRWQENPVKRRVLRQKRGVCTQKRTHLFSKTR